MMSHTVSPEKLAAQARIMADAGCQCVYVVDSAGALVLEGVADRVAALVAELGDDAQVGFHGHENLGLGVANSVEAVRAGAKQIDGSCRRFGAGAGNAPVEALIGVFDKIGVKTGIDFFEIADAAEEVVAPAMPAECLLDRNALIMGYSGVYSSFLKHAIRQAERYGVPAHLLLHRAGQRKLIGGQEDQLIDIALEIKREQDAATVRPRGYGTANKIFTGQATNARAYFADAGCTPTGPRRGPKCRSTPFVTCFACLKMLVPRARRARSDSGPRSADRPDRSRAGSARRSSGGNPRCGCRASRARCAC